MIFQDLTKLEAGEPNKTVLTHCLQYDGSWKAFPDGPNNVYARTVYIGNNTFDDLFLCYEGGEEKNHPYIWKGHKGDEF